MPRLKCSEHGVVQVAVPWAEARSPFTAPFEYAVIDWPHVAPLAAIPRWSVAHGGQPAEFPDFTRGLWVDTGPLGVVN